MIKDSNPKIKALATALAAVTAFALTFGVGAQQAKNWKSQDEYNMYKAVMDEPDLAKKLPKMDQWKEKFAASDFAPDRLDMYFGIYQNLKQIRPAIATAQEILKDRPNDYPALGGILSLSQQLNPIQPADLDLVQKTVDYFRANMDKIFADANKPATIDAKQWPGVKAQVAPYIMQTQTWIWTQRKDNARTETEATALLKQDGTQAQASYALAAAMLAQNKTNPEKQVPALYHFARAAAYAGPNALPAQNRTAAEQYVTRIYTSYHGSADGLKELMAIAKDNAFPPADFTIKSTADFEREKILKAQEEMAKDPVMALWRNIKSELTGDSGDKNFEENLKDKGLPTFKGKIVASTQTKGMTTELQMGVENPATAEVILKFEDDPLPGMMMNGEELEFTGAAKSFTKNPYQIVASSDPEDIKGWTGKAPKGAAATKAKAPGAATTKGKAPAAPAKK